MASFVVYSSLCAHVSRCHRSSHRTHSHLITSAILGYKVSCGVPYCKVRITTMKELFVHIRKHIQEDKVAMCPFKNCGKEFTNHKTFSAHTSRKHRYCGFGDLESSVLVEKPLNQQGQLSVSAATETSLSEANVSSVISLSEVDDADSERDMAINLLKKFGLFCLKLQSKYLVPSVTVQAVVDEFASMSGSNMQYMLHVLQKHLNNLGISEEKQREIFSDLTENNLCCMISEGPLRSIASCNVYFKTNLQYVSPVEVSFGLNSVGVRMKMHYVPIIESLKTLFANNRQNIHLGKHTSADSLYRDIHDGSVYKSNRLIMQSDECFSIVLYQDSFEIVNPLGSGKKKAQVVSCVLHAGKHNTGKSISD